MSPSLEFTFKTDELVTALRELGAFAQACPEIARSVLPAEEDLAFTRRLIATDVDGRVVVLRPSEYAEGLLAMVRAIAAARRSS